jgi:flagellar basal body rod protein FlgF
VTELDDEALADIRARQENAFRNQRARAATAVTAGYDASRQGLRQHSEVELDAEVEEDGWATLRADLVQHYVYHKSRG